MKENSRIIYLDILRIIAILGVLMIHSSASLATINYETIDFYTANFFNVISRFCVPLFLMISGALLISNIDSLPIFLKKRFLKVLIPAFFWFICYGIFNNYYLSKNVGIEVFFHQVLSGNLFFHLYFINLIIGAYLFIPILNQIAKDEKLTIYYLLIWIFVGTITPLIEKFTGIKINLYLNEFFGWSGYLLLGYYLKNLNIRISQLLLFFVFLLGFVFSYFGLIGLYSDVKIDKFFYGYKSLGILLESITLFLIFKQLNLKNNKFIIFLSDAAFGVYLIHGMVMFVLKDSFGIRASYLEYNPIINILIVFFLITFLSYIIVFLLKKIPYLKRVV